MAALSACCLFIGLAPSAMIGMLNAALAQWAPASEDVLPRIESYVSLGWISALSAILLALVALLALCLLWRPGRLPSRTGPTWDCGFARASARIQYSGSSFSQMLVDLLSWILCPRRRQPRIEAPFPGRHEF